MTTPPPMALPASARRRRIRPLFGAFGYIKRGRATCFVCATVAREPGYDNHHIVYEDDHAIAFLAKWPTMWGHTLVAPKEHREHVVGDRHVHWHVAPLPPGVSLPRQQFRAFSQVIAGEIECTDDEWTVLAARIREEIERVT